MNWWNRYTLRRAMRLFVALIIVAFLVFHITDLIVWLHKGFLLMSPFLIGCAMAFVLNAPLRFFENRVFVHIKNKWFKRYKRVIGILLSLILIAVLLTLIGVIVIPQLIDSIALFASSMPHYMDSLENLLTYIENKIPNSKEQIDQMLEYINSLSPETVQQGIFDFVRAGPLTDDNGENILSQAVSSTFGLVSSIFGIMLNAVLGFVFSIYILMSKEKLAIQSRRVIFSFFDIDNAKYIIHVFQVAFAKFYSFLTGQLMEACILGSLMCIGMFILRLPYPLMIGVLIGFSALIPIAGAIIGGAVGFLLVLSVNPTKAIIFMIFMIALQQFESNVIYPRVVGGSVGLPSMWTLLAITLGGSLMGLVGMLIFVPIVSTLYSLFAEIVYGRLQMKNVSATDPLVVYGVPDDKRLSP